MPRRPTLPGATQAPGANATSCLSMLSPPRSLCGFYAFGGIFQSGPSSTPDVLQDFWAFDAVQQRWLKLNSRPPRRYGASLSLREADGALVLFGGMDQTLSHALGDTWLYDPGSAEWAPIPREGKQPGARSGHLAGVLDGVGPSGTLLVALGQNVRGHTPTTMYRDAFALDLATRECAAAASPAARAPALTPPLSPSPLSEPRWRELSLKSLAPARVLAAGAMVRGALLMNGGFMYEDLRHGSRSGFVFSDLLRLRVLGDGQDAVWEKANLPSGPSVRYRHAASASADGSRLHINAGLFRSVLGDTWSVDPASVDWREPTSEDFNMQEGAVVGSPTAALATNPTSLALTPALRPGSGLSRIIIPTMVGLVLFCVCVGIVNRSRGRRRASVRTQRRPPPTPLPRSPCNLPLPTQRRAEVHALRVGRSSTVPLGLTRLGPGQPVARRGLGARWGEEEEEQEGPPRLTRYEVRLLPRERYTGPADAESGPDSCVICLGEFNAGEELRKLPCGHVFHVECVDEWLTASRAECPLCKRPVEF